MIAAMIRFSVKAFDAVGWHAVLADLADQSLPQAWSYGAAKVATGLWRVERGILENDSATVGAAQVLIRDLPGGLPGGLAWVSRGPLWRPDRGGDDRDRLSDAMAALAKHYVGRHGYYLRMAPPAPDGILYAIRVAVAGPVHITPLAGWASAFVNLTQPLNELRAGLAQKWRNAANKAERSGVTVAVTAVAGGGENLRFDNFLSDYADFLTERAIDTTVTPDLLRSIAAHSSREDGLVLLEATQGGECIGWALIARVGDTAEYLVGVVGKIGRNVGAGQLLLWRAVAAMHELGCRRFDLGGLDPDLTPEGIRRFKEGLGGTPYRMMNEVEVLPRGLILGPVGRLVRWRVGRARAALTTG
jgi:hypothetical protein